MTRAIKILLQATIPSIADDWNINRFSLLRDHLSSLTDDDDNAIYDVTARDREENADGNDTVLSVLDTTDFSELCVVCLGHGEWLEWCRCTGVTRFCSRGGG